MPKFLVLATITAKGLEGTLKEGGSARRAAVQQAVESLGGKLDAFYYAFGPSDVVAIVDMPSTEAMTAFAATVASAGAANPTTTVLITPEQVDAAVKLKASYRPPGA